jgi:molecular chaperone GrpE
MKEKENLEQVEVTIDDQSEDQLKNAEDKYIRLYAEFENYKRRVQKEKEELLLNTKTRMLSSILDMDNDVSIAIKNIKDESAREGVELIAQKLENFLKSQGIETIQTETYDDELHEVISVVTTGEKSIVDVVSKGYMLNGKPFRHPKIVISQ